MEEKYPDLSDPKDIQLRKDYSGISDEDESLLKEAKPPVEKNMERLVEGFWSHLIRFEETKRILKEEQKAENFRKAVPQYILQLFSGDYGPSYVRKRIKTGMVHFKLGLAPRWYLGALNILHNLLQDVLKQYYSQDEGRLIKTLGAVEKMLIFDYQYMAEVYELEYEAYLLERTQQLALAKKFTEGIIRSMRNSLLVTDMKWNIRDVNPQLESLLGYKREELLGKPVSILIPKEEALFREDNLKKLLNGEGFIPDYNAEFLTKKKETIPVLFTGSVLKDDNGQPIGMVGIARDMRQTLKLINTLQQTNEELAASNARFQTIMRSVRVPIATLDMKRNIVSINSAFESLTGWKQDEAPGANYDVLLSLAIGTKGFKIEEPYTWIGKAVIRDREDKKIDVSYTEAPLNAFDGNPIGIVCTMEDISKEAEIDRMKTEFISTVSHELRTPLTSIKGYVDLILEGDTGPVNDTQKEFLQIVAQSSNRLAQLINDLLDVERIESEKIAFKKEPVNVTQIIHQVIRTFQKEIEKKGIHLNTKFEKETIIVEGDRERIEQALANLVSNAIKYNRPAGCIGVWARLENRFVRVEVEDSGIGIGEEDQRRLFEKFFRADTSRSREVGGTGLGLSIVKAIVDRLGGEIKVKSKLGEGTTFTILLPLYEKAILS
ncbi:MAG TPA: ATP-binding protein [Candidatus Hypogeohydataceae bacterium YC41]